jgi:hypothetical protein
MDRTLYLDGAQTGSRQPVPGQEVEANLNTWGLCLYIIQGRSMAIVGFALLHCQNNMDATSTGDSAPNPNTHSTSPGSIDFSIDDLLKRVEEFQRRQQLETLERITTENSWLEYHIARYRQNSTRTMNLLQEIFNAVTLMQKALQQCRLEEIKANRSWLAFWGIREDPDTTSDAPPAGWI